MSDTLLPYSRFRTLVVLRTFSYEDFTIVAFCRCDGSRSCKIACFLWIAALRSNRQLELHSGVVFSNAVTIDFSQYITKTIHDCVRTWCVECPDSVFRLLVLISKKSNASSCSLRVFFNRCVVRVCVVIVSLSSVIVFPKESNASSCSLRVFLIRCVVRVCVVIVSLSSVIAVYVRAL